MAAIDITELNDYREKTAELIDEYGGVVYKFCRRITFSKEEADDLFQETFLKVFEGMPKCLKSDSPKGFIFSVASFTWKDWKRKYARRSRLAPGEPLIDSIADEKTATEAAQDQDEILTVRALVNSLPDKLKLPVILFYTLDMSVPEIAVTLKIPEGTVKSRLFNARKIIERGLTE